MTAPARPAEVDAAMVAALFDRFAFANTSPRAACPTPGELAALDQVVTFIGDAAAPGESPRSRVLFLIAAGLGRIADVYGRTHPAPGPGEAWQVEPTPADAESPWAAQTLAALLTVQLEAGSAAAARALSTVIAHAGGPDAWALLVETATVWGRICVAAGRHH